MEQKRSLLILIASGIFLLIVLGAALILHSPSKFDFNKNNTFASPFAKNAEVKTKPQIDLINSNEVKKEEIEIPNQNYFNVMDSDEPYSQTAVTQDSPIQDSPAAQAAQAEIHTAQVALVPQSTQDSPALVSQAQNASTPNANAQNITTGSLTVIANGATKIYGSQDNITIDLNPSYTQTTSPVVIAQNEAAKKAINETKENRIYETTKIYDKKPKANSDKQNSNVKESTKTETKKASSSTSAANTKKTAEKKASSNTVTKTETKVPDRFWVQVASYTSKKTADEARAKLDSNKIQCEVFTHNNGNKLYYRVRVGPYTTKTEAEYWKKRLEEIDTFKNCGSYIVNSSAAK